MSPNATGRRTFGPVLLAGTATAGLCAVASSQTWLVAHGSSAGLKVTADIAGSDAAPLSLALALVSLASWGVILVSGTPARRVAAVLGLLAAAGALAVVIVLWPHADDVAGRVLADKGAREVADLSRAGWYWIAGLAALGQVAALAAAYRLAPTWPTMSSRYDAPGAGPSGSDAGDPAAPIDDLELWKALDQGLDPTQRPGPDAP